MLIKEGTDCKRASGCSGSFLSGGISEGLQISNTIHTAA